MSIRKFLDDNGAVLLNTILANKFASKQDVLTEGANINIANNTISVDGDTIKDITEDARIYELDEGIYKVLGESNVVKLYYNDLNYLLVPKNVSSTLIVQKATSSVIKYFFLFVYRKIYFGQANDFNGSRIEFETTSNKITSISSSSTNTQYPGAKAVYDSLPKTFTGTDGQTAGTGGLIPAPSTTDVGKYLKSDGTWAEVQDIYSTTEQRVGTWIDGKPLYRKTTTILNATGNKTFTMVDEYILDTLVKIEGTLHDRTTSQFYNINCYESSQSRCSVKCSDIEYGEFKIQLRFRVVN